MPVPSAFMYPLSFHMSFDIDCSMWTDEECSWYSQFWHNWYVADLAFGRSTVYFFSAVIALFAIVHAIQLFRRTMTGSKMVNLPSYQFLAHMWRGAFSHQMRFGRSIYAPTNGVIVLIGIAIVFFLGLTLGPQPYYWPKGDYFGGSPPIATRSGWAALGVLPFMVILASKWNVITLVTGVSHEQLNILHQWSAWIMYVLTLMHTFPFIVFNIKQGTMVEQMQTNGFYWTGLACLVPQTIMMVLSLSPIRNLAYEFFKIVHITMAIVFIVMLFCHVEFTMTSADYFVVLGAIYVFSLLVRWGRVFFKNGISHIAQFQTIDHEVLKISIPTKKLSWSPGQHFFVRFYNAVGIHSFTSHPFTVASVPEQGEIELYMKIHKGITARLASLAKGSGYQSRVLLDGPYGGVTTEFNIYDHVLLTAGGSGGSFTLSVLQHLVRRPAGVRSITVIYATKSKHLLHAFYTAFEEAGKLAPSSLSIAIHLHDTSLAVNEKESDILSTNSAKDRPFTLTTHPGRPHLSVIVQDICSDEGTIGVATCGTEEFNLDVRNTVAAQQRRVANGFGSATEIYLHAEAFGW